MSDSYQIFDRDLVKTRGQKRDGANSEDLYLFREGAEGLSERLKLINRPFPRVLAFGPFINADLFPEKPGEITQGQDPEVLDFPEKSFDLVIANLVHHWVNDLPGALLQINRVLKPDGLFMGVMLGGETLKELRHCLLLAETEVKGGASPRVSPFVEVKDAGHLLQRAGFAMPVSDLDKLAVSYGDPFCLMQDLKAMGENNALLGRQKTFAPKALFARMAEIYAEKFGDAEGRIPATFEFLHLSGWAPGPNQPKPLKPGSGKVDLRDVFENKD